MDQAAGELGQARELKTENRCDRRWKRVFAPAAAWVIELNTMTEELQRQISRPLGQIPSGCFVVTARHADRATGMLASWVQQAGFEPPAVSVAVRKGRPVQELIEASGHFVLNQIPEQRGPMFRQFGKGFGPDEPAFEGLSVREEPAGVVIESCAGYLGCRVLTWADSGDHRIYIGEVISGTMHGDLKPYVHLRNNGLSY